jgi:hypothetical protein
MRVGKVYVQLLQNDCPYEIGMVITYVRLRNDYKGQMSHSYWRIHCSQQQIIFVIYTSARIINYYDEYKTHTKASLNANAH